MITTSTCPGCPRPTTKCAPACPECMTRLPSELQRALTALERERSDIHQHAITWLTDHPRLSERELQVLRLVAEGHRDSVIAHTLQLSINTIRDHIKRVTRRLGCSGRAHLMATAYQKGYLGSETVCAL